MPQLRPSPDFSDAVGRAAHSVPTLADAARDLVEHAPETDVRAAEQRGWFRPVEEERLVEWLVRFTAVREGLWEVIGELMAGQAARAGDGGGGDDLDDLGGLEETTPWRAFVLGYGAAGAIVHLDRFLVESLALTRVSQRKLNEGVAEQGLARKLYTSVFDSLTDPQSAMLLREAMGVRRRQARRLRADADDPLLCETLARIRWLESSLDPSRRRFFRLFARFQAHALRRSLASARDQGLFAALEGSCRVVAELKDHWRPRRVTEEMREHLAPRLRPGDVIVTRTEGALSNAFLPGHWPHAALHVGTADDRERLGIRADAQRSDRWSGDRRVLEALKDGVRFRPLAETLAVDAFAVLRPRLDEGEVARAIERVVRHEGKEYDFDFDFFRSDRLVCSEVVYRAYDGVGGIELTLRERAGRPTLSAQDLVELTLAGAGFDLVAAWDGRPGEPPALTPDAARRLVSERPRS